MAILIQPNDRPLRVFQAAANAGAGTVQDTLQAAGLRTMVTGDLRYSDLLNGGCQCPYLDEKQCRCREVIMLVYSGDEPPVTLILQCRGAWTCVYLCSSSAARENAGTRQRLIELLLQE